MMAFARRVSARSAAAAALATYAARGDSNMDGKQPFRVLVVGAGLGGCLAAKELRRRFGDAAELHVWERATYTAGRFGAVAKAGELRVDLGAQVLSVVDPGDPRALPGHGITRDALEGAWTEVQALKERGLVEPVGDEQLAPTEERLLWPELWRQYAAVGSLSDVCAALLADARPDAVHFGRRVDGLERDATFVVAAAQRDGDGIATPARATFDAVVLAVPAPDALAIDGVADALPSELADLVRRTRYDARTATAVFLRDDDGEASRVLDRVFGDSVERDGLGGLELVHRHGRGGPVVAVVAHSAAAAAVAQQLSVADVLAAIDAAALRPLVVSSKTVRWHCAQMITPLEALRPRNPVDRGPCVCDESSTLVLAGDYCTQSSFLGAYASSRAAAEAVHRGYLRRSC